jgi:hypothetical protein
MAYKRLIYRLERAHDKLLNAWDILPGQPEVNASERRITGLGKYNLQPYTKYPLDPPHLSCWLELPKKAFSEE